MSELSERLVVLATELERLAGALLAEAEELRSIAQQLALEHPSPLDRMVEVNLDDLP